MLMCSVAVITVEPRYIKTNLHITILSITNDFLPHSTTKIYEKEPRYNETSLWRTNSASPLALQLYILSNKLWCHGGHIVYNIMRRRPCRCTKKNHVGVDTHKLTRYLGFQSLQKERQYKDISMSPLVYMRMQNLKQCIYSILTLSSLHWK